MLFVFCLFVLSFFLPLWRFLCRRFFAFGLLIYIFVSSAKKFRGESGIRTHDALLRHTHFPGVHLKPLGHFSKLRQVACAYRADYQSNEPQFLPFMPLYSTKKRIKDLRNIAIILILCNDLRRNFSFYCFSQHIDCLVVRQSLAEYIHQFRHGGLGCRVGAADHADLF